MAICEVKPELWVNRFQQIKKQLVVDRPSEMAQKIDQQARVIFMETIYGPDVKSIVQEWKREKIIPGPTYKVTPEGLTCLYAGKEISLRELAVDNVKEQTPQNHNSKEEEILLSAQRAILQSPTAEVVFPVYNKDGKIRYLSQWKRKDNFVETAMIDISQDGQDKTLEEAKMLMEQMAEEKKGRIKTDLDKQVELSVGLAKATEAPVLMIQFIETQIPLTTALHSNVVNDHDNSVIPILPESVPLFLALEPLFAFPLESSPALQNMRKEFYLEKTEIPVVEHSETAADSPKLSSFNRDLVTWQPIFEKEQAQVQIVSMFQNIQRRPILLNVFQPRTLMIREAVDYEVKKTEERGQTHHAVACPDCPYQGVVVAEKVVIEVAQTEQQPLFEKAVKELNLPLLKISSKTAPEMVIRAALKPARQMAEQSTAFDLETDPMAVMEREEPKGEKIVLIDDQLHIPIGKKIMAEVDRKQRKLFVVKNFSVVSSQAAKTEKEPDFQIKKMFWRIKTLGSSGPTEVSILEFELPKDQNQRLYAFYHFLQKVVKKAAGQDAIRTRQVTVIAEKETVDPDLELVLEIEYYLKLLRRKRNYAQAFAFVN